MTARRLLPSLALILALALTATPASAKAPPKGKYDCVIGSSYILFGTLTIKKGVNYAHRGTKGTFKHGKKLKTDALGLRFHTIGFKDGSLDGIKGRWYKATDGTPQGTYEIALRNPRDDFESIYCGKRK